MPYGGTERTSRSARRSGQIQKRFIKPDRDEYLFHLNFAKSGVGKRPYNHRVAERTEDGRTETTIAQKKMCYLFQVLGSKLDSTSL